MQFEKHFKDKNNFQDKKKFDVISLSPLLFCFIIELLVDPWCVTIPILSFKMIDYCIAMLVLNEKKLGPQLDINFTAPRFSLILITIGTKARTRQYHLGCSLHLEIVPKISRK